MGKNDINHHKEDRYDNSGIHTLLGLQTYYTTGSSFVAWCPDLIYGKIIYFARFSSDLIIAEKSSLANPSALAAA